MPRVYHITILDDDTARFYSEQNEDLNPTDFETPHAIAHRWVNAASLVQFFGLEPEDAPDDDIKDTP